MGYLYLRVDELRPRDAVHIYDEETSKDVIARVATINDGKVVFTDGATITVYDSRSTVKVSRLRLIKTG